MANRRSVLAQIMLHLFGLPLAESLALNAVMLIVSWLRSYLIQAAFARIERHLATASAPAQMLEAAE